MPDTARHRALSAASRVRMLDLVRRAEGGLTAADVAAATGLHPSTVRAHLDQLTESGLLVRSRRGDGSPGRPAWRYQATTRAGSATGVSDTERPYRELAAALIGQLARDADDPHAAGVRVGRAWGRALAAPLAPTAPIGGLVRVLDGLGFTPQVVDRPTPSSAVVHLRSCPYLDVALKSPDVVCGVHQGVVGGVLGALGALGVDAELDPFGAAGACVVRVRINSSATPRPEGMPDSPQRMLEGPAPAAGGQER